MDAEQSIYPLNNGVPGSEESRLEHQHHIFVRITNGLIPANIAAYLSSLIHKPAIADIGTGTGNWLRDIAAILPSDSRLDGYDFDQSKFPDQTKLPANVKLSFADALKPFPAPLLRTYDLVHVRLFIYALKANQWETVVANLRTLLRPGGYLMWDETGYTSWQCLPMTEAFGKWIRTEVRYATSVGRDTTSPLLLQHHFEAAGLVHCAQQQFSSFAQPKDLQRAAGSVLIAAGHQAMHGVVDRGGFEWVKSHEVVDALATAIQADIESDLTQVGFSIYWIVGQSPK